MPFRRTKGREKEKEWLKARICSEISKLEIKNEVFTVCLMILTDIKQ